MRQQQILIVLTIGILVFSLVSLSVQVYELSQLESHDETTPFTGRASSSSNGEVSFCINNAPNVSASSCSTTLSQGTPFTCQLNLSDVDGDTVEVDQLFMVGRAIFNVTTNGSINFTPSNDDVGTYSVNFTGDDLTNCSNALFDELFDFTVANINDPPYLAVTIPDINLTVNTTLSPFFLNDYFVDPDNDVLNYTSSVPTNLTIDILNTSEVRFYTPVCAPTTHLVTFTAEDPYNETANSNPVTVTVLCSSPDDGGDDDDDDDDDSSGGRGGGGGGCLPDWECQEWFPCLPSDEQWQRCYDTAACQSDRYLQKICEYVGEPPVCQENWLCDEWSNCLLNETQHRMCEDLSTCSTEIVKPPEVQECIYIPTCNDGIQNGDEEGIDCGGVCAICPLVEQPVIIETGIASWILWILILCILITGGAMHYYRTEIAKGIAFLGFLLRKEAYKEILLTKEQRNRLFELLVRFEDHTMEQEPDEVYDALALLVRQYVNEAFELPIEAFSDEVVEKCKERGLRSETTNAITGLFSKLEILEQEELEFDPYFVQYTVEEIRTLICLTSEYDFREIERSLSEMEIAENMSFYDELFARMTNVLRAVQFDQLDVAKKEYMKLLEMYDPLSEDEREQVYPELTWTFAVVKFATEIEGVRHLEKSA